ncbi:hypothetical protein LOTGIDRAFT_236369 [Lottia gigantea]|uniref:F-box domain-containing protein n=1 Tax=Lottia gigantea TaxID=225164 RepID=V3Z078_LOTGI|nr:hypothetical protein LOTGIDRAFT_236369 [Lottia gigantea]ESO83843.1 hypothetical protein LOTGIDRAFT_236369 [Lottia gigantea]
MEIQKLPKELQFYILSKCDGDSLINSGKVCTLWLEIIDVLEKSFHIWTGKCLNEIPRRYLVQLTGIPELLDKRNDSYCKDVPWTFWKDVYFDYNRMSVVRDWIPERKVVMMPSQLNTCTALRSRDNILVSGHIDGNVVLWKDEVEPGRFKLLTRHRSHVTAVDMLNTVESMKEVGEWVDGYTVVSVSRDSSIHVSNPLSDSVKNITLYRGSVNNLSCWGSKFVVAAESSILNGQPVWKVDHDKTVNVLHELYGHEESCISAATCWNDQIISGDVIGNLYQWKLNSTTRQQCRPVIVAKFSESYTKQIYFDGYILLCLLGDGSICWRVGNQKFQTTPNKTELEIFSATPTCLACRARLLVVGLNSGNVLVYYIATEESWLTFNPAVPTCRFRACSDSINCIDVCHDGNTPVIVVSSTNEGISRFTFRPP